MKPNFNIYKQCPQVYAYMFSAIAALLLAVKAGKKMDALFIYISTIVTTVMLMGINFCDWYFQWYTWLLAIIFVLSGLMDLIELFYNKQDTKEQTSQ